MTRITVSVTRRLVRRYTRMPVLAKRESVVDAAFEKYYDARARAAQATGAVELGWDGVAIINGFVEAPLYLFEYWTADDKGWRKCFTYRNMTKFIETGDRRLMDVSDKTNAFWLHGELNEQLAMENGEEYTAVTFNPDAMGMAKNEAMINNARIADWKDLRELARSHRPMLETLLRSHSGKYY